MKLRSDDTPYPGSNPQQYPAQQLPISAPVTPEVFNAHRLTKIATFWFVAGLSILLVILAAGDRFPQFFQTTGRGRLADFETASISTGAFLTVGWIIVGPFSLMILIGVLLRQPGTGKGQLLQVIMVILGAVLVPGILPVVVTAFAAGDGPNAMTSEMIYVFSIVLVLPSLIFSFVIIKKPKMRRANTAHLAMFRKCSQRIKRSLD